jgi:spermidine/putrescine transport system ATP-binding protein
MDGAFMTVDRGRLELSGIVRTFHGSTSVGPIDLEIRAGEFFSLLGPSGCGKTTTLRMIAGFEFPDHGRVALDGVDLTNLPARRRPMNIVFQRYELFPHMTVEANIGYGLRVSRTPKPEIRTRVGDMMEMVGIEQLATRRADQLSGGQQQRVALARALVNRPRVLLLDEPLSALDVKLRDRMRRELKAIQHAAGTTFVFVTHDQSEALALSDRVAVMHAGKVVQVGSPESLYNQPTSDFVADFVGAANKFEVVLTADGAALGANLAVGAPGHRRGEHVTIRIRPERLRVTSEAEGAAGANHVNGKVAELSFGGEATTVEITTPLGALQARMPAGERGFAPGDGVVVSWNDADVLTTARTIQGERLR